MGRCNELLLDTNFIIEAAKRRLLDSARDAVPGAKLVTLEAVVGELEAQGQRLALELVRAEGVRVIPGGGYADKAIADYAARGGVAVATNDKALKRRLAAMGVPVLSPTAKGCMLTEGEKCTSL